MLAWVAFYDTGEIYHLWASSVEQAKRAAEAALPKLRTGVWLSCRDADVDFYKEIKKAWKNC